MGRPDGEIMALAEGSRGLDGVKRALMGSGSDCVVHHARCPGLVVRAEGD
jgi:nucleotide-binding universal stress UspA family protein